MLGPEGTLPGVGSVLPLCGSRALTSGASAWEQSAFLAKPSQRLAGFALSHSLSPEFFPKCPLWISRSPSGTKQQTLDSALWSGPCLAIMPYLPSTLLLSQPPFRPRVSAFLLQKSSVPLLCLASSSCSFESTLPVSAPLYLCHGVAGCHFSPGCAMYVNDIMCVNDTLQVPSDDR